MDSATGLLTPIDMDGTRPGIQPAPTGIYPIAIAAHPSQKFLYVVNFNSGTISAFAVDPGTGVVTQIAANAQDAGLGSDGGPLLDYPNSGVFGIVEPTGRCLYVVSEGGTLNAISIDPATGKLSPGRQVATASAAEWIAVDPKGRFLVVQGTGQEVAIHKIDPATGLPLAVDGGLGPGTKYATPLAYTVSLDQAGTAAYVPGYFSHQIVGFRIDPSTLAMSPIPSADSGGAPILAVAHPSAPLLYVSGTTAPVRVFAIGDAGALSEVSATDPVGVRGVPMALDPAGAHLYLGGYTQNYLFDVVGSSLVTKGRPDDGGPYNATRTFAWIRP